MCRRHMLLSQLPDDCSSNGHSHFKFPAYNLWQEKDDAEVFCWIEKRIKKILKDQGCQTFNWKSWERDLFNLRSDLRIRISGILDSDSKGSQDFLLLSCSLESWYVQVYLLSLCCPRVKSRVPRLLSQRPSQGKVPTLTLLQKKKKKKKRCQIWHPVWWKPHP